MEVDVKSLIECVRKETGIKLESDDPILAVAVLHEKLMGALLASIEAAAQQAAGEMASSASHGVAAARQNAGRIVTEAMEWGCEQLRATGVEIAATVLHETQAEAAKAEAARGAAVRASRIAMVASAVGSVVVGGLVLAAVMLG